MGPHMGREGRASSPSAEPSLSTRPASGAGRGWLAGSWPLFSLEGKHRLCAASPAALGHFSVSTACLRTQAPLRATAGAGARPLCPGGSPLLMADAGRPQGRQAVGTGPVAPSGCWRLWGWEQQAQQGSAHFQPRATRRLSLSQVLGAVILEQGFSKSLAKPHFYPGP